MNREDATLKGRRAGDRKDFFFLGVLCGLRVEKMTKHRFAMDFEETMKNVSAVISA
jgi:hypothetical protein